MLKFLGKIAAGKSGLKTLSINCKRMLTEKDQKVNTFFSWAPRHRKPANHKICRFRKIHSQYAVASSDRVFHRFTDRELDGGLGRDLDHGTGRGVAAVTSFAMSLL